MKYSRAHEILEMSAAGAAVLRFHAVSTLRPNTVGHHSHGVAMACWVLHRMRFGCAPSAELLMAALTHDLAEQHFGDMPGPTKRVMGPKLSEEEAVYLGQYDMAWALREPEQKILSFADNLDGLLWCSLEVQHGNRTRNIANVVRKYYEYCLSHAVSSDEANLVKGIYFAGGCHELTR